MTIVFFKIVSIDRLGADLVLSLLLISNVYQSVITLNQVCLLMVNSPVHSTKLGDIPGGFDLFGLDGPLGKSWQHRPPVHR